MADSDKAPEQQQQLEQSPAQPLTTEAVAPAPPKETIGEFWCPAAAVRKKTPGFRWCVCVCVGKPGICMYADVCASAILYLAKMD